MLNIRSGLVKPCKIKFFGDYKKEQVEKYKPTVLSKLLFFQQVKTCDFYTSLTEI